MLIDEHQQQGTTERASLGIRAIDVLIRRMKTTRHGFPVSLRVDSKPNHLLWQKKTRIYCSHTKNYALEARKSKKHVQGRVNAGIN